MTPRELLVLVRLFEATTDPALRRWAISHIPELAEWDKPELIRDQSGKIVFIEPSRPAAPEDSKVWRPSRTTSDAC